MHIQNIKTKTPNTKLHNTIEIGIQDIYATFLLYNVFCYSKIYLNLIINKNMIKKGKTNHYEVNQSNLISRLKIDLFETILDPSKVKNFINNLIKKCIPAPNKVKELREYERKKITPNRYVQTQYKPTF